ncbi:hypothetical protein RND81_09G167000 [Saponaria officinalis]|uniref:Uncharacterized protein n=1 Tax=Saponaria officinalis TaxID=3572 RepID=A0AAW1ING4_SAPOF
MKVISECFVKPKHEVEASKDCIYLNPTEIAMLGAHPIQKGMLFALHQPTPSTVVPNLFHKLQNSLSIVLLHFYPLAGRFATQTLDDEHACIVFIDCNKGPGAKLTHVVAPNVTISDIVSPTHVPIIVRKFFDLGEEFVNYDCHTRPLLSIQVTELVDGVFIGFTMNHSVVDGTPFMHLVSMLSEVFCSKSTSGSLLEISKVPIYERAPLIKLPYLGLERIMVLRETAPLKDRVFHFTSKSLALLKAKANQECFSHEVSSFQSLASFIWRSITRARNLSADQETACCLVMNARARIDPPVSDHYFGNYLAHAQTICRVGDLQSHDLGWAAKRVNDSIKAQDDKAIRSLWNWAADNIATPGFFSSEIDFHGPNAVVIGGSARFDMYGLEFGLGKAVVVRTGFANKIDGKVTASQGCEGGGSVDLEISLIDEHMAALEADHEFMSFVS